jgi:uncharacterized delta-60 repeat protein
MMNRVWRVVLLVAMVCFALGATAVAATAKPSGKPTKSKGGGGAPGQLDSTFGKGGKVTVDFPAENAGSTGPKYQLPFEFTPGHLEMAKAPGGKVVVAGATKVVRYLANGKLDSSFGQGGSVAIPRPPGAVFVLAGVAVDSDGRVVLAGLTRPLPSNSTPDPVLSSAALIRLNANGTPDTSFGTGGTVITNFGFGVPKAPGGPYPGTSVGLRDVVIDSQNRPVVTGGYVSELTGSRENSAVSKGFVARLTETGALDPTLGEAGIRGLSNIASFGQLAPHSAGYLTLATGTERPSDLLTGIDGNGNLDSNFGSFGFRTLKFAEAPALTIAPSGKILLLGRPESRRAYKTRKRKDEETGKIVSEKVRISVKFQAVQRLLPSGAADPSFDRIGTNDYVESGSESISALAVDSKERIYLAGRVGKRVSKSAKNTLRRSSFTLTRTEAGGAVDRSFGKNGKVTTGFGGPTSSFATQVMLDAKGRILVGGGIVSPQLETGGGFAIARYLPGS